MDNRIMKLMHSKNPDDFDLLFDMTIDERKISKLQIIATLRLATAVERIADTLVHNEDDCK